ncbi:MAG: hypothetical protein EPN82_04925 [Bacteroidetes bacterium]|nr:MAG: hypothetical protein EPN82_04925 [Bacteroidota bacterium]
MSIKKPHFQIDKEYETLRTELFKVRQYIFERPIIIITGSIALIQLIEKQYSIYLPIIIIGLLLFNLWFTVNRWRSMARILAYIQIVLENEDSNWYGWETSLRYFRKWIKHKNINVNKIIINKEKDIGYAGYFPIIYFVHIFLTICVSIVLFIYTLLNDEMLNLIVLIITLICLFIFLIYAFNVSPKKIRPNVERNRIVWIEVFEHWEELDTN